MCVCVCERERERESSIEVDLALEALERGLVTLGLWMFSCGRRGCETERLLTVMVCVCVCVCVCVRGGCRVSLVQAYEALSF